MKKIALLVVAAVALSGCAGMAFPRANNGWLYAETKTNDAVNNGNVQAGKTGEACATSILGWVTTGDSTVPAAAKAGGIKNVVSVDNKFVNYVGVYSQFCTVVTGD
jgi:hypothetical protein